jgi:3-hydroxyisobutyrate dehydrogenase-like beta-hydroxyacid dehydrogenase
VRQPETIGILYPGEMGAALGRLLHAGGFAVITALQGRSARTQRQAREAGIEVVGSMRELAARADLVLSVVSPAAAMETADGYLKSFAAPSVRPIYVDLNSISPQTVHRIEALLRGAPIDFVDGAIHGPASLLPGRGTVYLSGGSAERVRQRLERVFKVRALGAEVGRASALKMLIGGLNKGVAALFMELALAAKKAELYDELMACYGASYPGVMAIVERTLPSYPRHAPRRAEELREVEETLRSLGIRPGLTSATRALLEEMARLSWAESDLEAGSAADVVAAAQALGLMAAPADPASSP